MAKIKKNPKQEKAIVKKEKKVIASAKIILEEELPEAKPKKETKLSFDGALIEEILEEKGSEKLLKMSDGTTKYIPIDVYNSLKDEE